MDLIKRNKALFAFCLCFLLISSLFIAYATHTMRGLYEDGAFYMTEALNTLSQGSFHIHTDNEHPRIIMSVLQILPVYLAYFSGAADKFFLMKLYSFNEFFLPLVILIFNFFLTLRTKRTDVFFWHLFTYCLILLPFSIFACVESYIGAGLHFVLWNYLVSQTKIRKRDAVVILFCLFCMFGTYEYVMFLGFIIFFAHFKYILEEKSLQNQCFKTLIGLGSFAASAYTIWFMLKVQGESGEIARFFKECYDYIPHSFELCSLFSITAVILLILFSPAKKKIHPAFYIIPIGIFAFEFYRLLSIPTQSIYPMWEQHLRSIPCWAIPAIFIIMAVTDKCRTEINHARYINLITIVLLCGIAQTAWQINNTYYWDKNIKYMKQELNNYEGLLYVPSEHEEISSFHNEDLRRYIWHGVYTPTSILFSDNYKQKTLLMQYDIQQDEGNVITRNKFYVKPNKKEMSISFGAVIDIKNRYWDLTDCAEALDEYNKKNNIQTDE